MTPEKRRNLYMLYGMILTAALAAFLFYTARPTCKPGYVLTREGICIEGYRP